MSSSIDQYRDVWVYLQHENNSLTRESLELLAAGRKIADKLSQSLVAVLIGYGLGNLPRSAIEYGADEVQYIDSPSFKYYLNLMHIDAICQMIRERKPYAFLFIANELGRDIAARIAYRLKTGLATDNIQLEVEDYYNPAFKETFKNLLIQIRPDFGTRIAKIYTPRHRPQMATVRPGNFTPLKPDPDRSGKIQEFKFIPKKEYNAIVKEVRELPRPKVRLSDADVIISLGLGIVRDSKGNARNPREAYEYAMRLKDLIERKFGMRVEIGATRALIYAGLKELEGLITNDNQIGQTGVTVSPKIYIALGISGALQHKVGMQRSKKIVAINTDPNAPIFEITHYIIIGDLYEELPRLIGLVESFGNKA